MVAEIQKFNEAKISFGVGHSNRVSLIVNEKQKCIFVWQPLMFIRN